MNATTFFTEQQYHRLKQDIAQEKILHPTETPYKHTHKTNGNTYQLMITTGRYTYEAAKGQYYVSLWDDYNYKGIYDSRNIGGSNACKLVLDTFETFKESINNRLSKFPDYKEEEQPLQFAMVF